MLELGHRSKFALCAGGIFVCYFYYGILQERITRGNYGDERFTYSMALVFSQCLVNYLYALIMSATVLNQGEDRTKTSYYTMCSLSYLVAMVSSNKALMWVNYPTQVIGKSCKPIPVMILGVILGRKSYPLLKYLFVLLIVAGVALFMYKDKAGNSTEEMGLGLGEMMLLLSLACDGITGAIQERMKSEYQTKSGHMMKAMNLWSMLFLGAALGVTGEGFEFIGFVSRHPGVLWQILTFCVASAFGQFFIFMCVSDYGPLPCSIVTTTRKFFTVLASVLFFGNSLATRQWLGVALVFAGLFMDGAYGKTKPNKVQ
jgi:UDP-galactose transporter B1